MSDFVPSVALAVDDFVPVAVATVAVLLLARFAAATQIRGVPWRAWVGAVSIGVGGLCKAVWKLIVALGGPDLVLLEKALFWFLMPGFVTLAFALLCVWRGHELAHWIGGAPIAVGFTTGTLTKSEVPLLVVTIVAATAVSVLGLLLARQRGETLAQWLFGLQIALAFGLAPLAAPPQTEPKQWLEQSLNTVAQGLLLIAAWRLVKASHEPVLAPAPTAHAQEALT